MNYRILKLLVKEDCLEHCVACTCFSCKYNDNYDYPNSLHDYINNYYHYL